MTKISDNINSYQNLAQYDADMGKEYPNVSYLIDEDEVVYIKEPEYSKQYLTIISLSNNNTIRWAASDSNTTKKTIYISYNDGWINKTSTTEDGVVLATLNKGDKLFIKGVNTKYATTNSRYNYFKTTGSFDICGNIMSLIYGDNFVGKTTFNGDKYILSSIFRNCSFLHNAENLILPATTLVESCYSGMFRDCTNLTKAPILPATTMTEECYDRMFYNCTNLTTAPELPATTLVTRCYNYLFYKCTSINYIKAMFTTTPSASYTNFWTNGVAASGTFVKNSAATWNVRGSHGIPTGWTVRTANS